MKKIVYTFGVWDILHVGHINYLNKARSFGDKLVVGVQDDAAVLEFKPFGATVQEGQRRFVVENLKCVDTAELYHWEYIEKLKNAKANVLVMGEAHKNGDRFKDLYDYVTTNFGKDALHFVPYDSSISSSGIKETIRGYSWEPIWDKIAGDPLKNDYEICGYSSLEDAKTMARHIANTMKITPSDRVLDYGCGSGLILKNLNVADNSIGVDSSREIIKRAIKNNPNHIFLISNRPNIMCNNIDVVVCFGVLHYIPSMEMAKAAVLDMVRLAKRILIMEIPDIDKKADREANRRKMNMKAFPEHLYFSRKFFEDLGFTCYDNDIFLTKNSKYSFTAVMK